MKYNFFLFIYKKGGGEGREWFTTDRPKFYLIVSNENKQVHTALLPPSTGDGAPFSLDFDTGFFYMGSLYDDTHWNATPPVPTEPSRNVSNFHVCYQWTGGYWLRSLAWVSGLEGYPPQNPSCEPVNLGVESLGP